VEWGLRGGGGGSNGAALRHRTCCAVLCCAGHMFQDRHVIAECLAEGCVRC
jgi:hypothetical protein